MVVCKKCKTELEENSQFCPECGRELDVTALKKQTGNKTKLEAIIIIAVIIVAWLFISTIIYR